MKRTGATCLSRRPTLDRNSLKASNAISSRTESPGARQRSGESSSTIDRFTLSGPSADLDPRYNAYRGDLADAALASRLFAPHYAKAVARRLKTGASLHISPDQQSELMAELGAGEEFCLLDITGKWAWGYRASDHLVGYVQASALEDALK